MSRARTIVQRALLVPLSLLVLLVLAEIGLRIASHFVSRERGGSRAATTILCVGDSHTFGLHVIPALSYPARLQNDLDPEGSTIGVVNYGVPGRNSGALLARLQGYLDRLDPAVVLVLVGFNDSWNFDSNVAASDGGDDDSPSWLAQLRIARLFRILRLNLAGRKDEGPKVVEKDGKMMVVEDGSLVPAATGGKAFGVLTGDALALRVKKNLERIVATVRAHGATPVLLDYATENQACFLELNASARDVARALDAPFVELAIPFRDAIARDGYPAFFFDDDHPNARGNELVASLVATALRERGLVPPVTFGVKTGGPTVVPVLALDSIDGLRAVLRIHGPSLREFQVAFSPRRDPPLELRGIRLPIGDDPMLARCLEDLNLRGRTDEKGDARVACDLSRIGALAGAQVFGVVAFFSADVSQPPGTSPAIEVVPH